MAQDRLLGILCLQSATAGRFLSDDERVVRIAARQMAASMALLERVESTEPATGPTPATYRAADGHFNGQALQSGRQHLYR